MCSRFLPGSAGPPAPLLAAGPSCLKSSPGHSCLSHSPPAGSQSAASGGPGLRTHRVACQEPQASSLVICSRQAAPGPGSGGPHFFACQVLTGGGDECSGARSGVGVVAPASLSPGLLCTSLPTTTSRGWGGQHWTVRHRPQGAFDTVSLDPHIR